MEDTTQSRSILVVDDDGPLRKVIEICLRAEGHSVIGTCGREEILALLQSKSFDLVISDMLMPDIEGTEVINAVKTHQPQAAILAMSGGGCRITPELCLAIAKTLGAGILLLKPFETAKLIRAVEQSFSPKK